LSRGASKRRLRIRRKRRDGSFAGDAITSAGGEVVAQFGCCLVEAVGGISVFLALLLVPAVFFYG
jgi:hypothetical protein